MAISKIHAVHGVNRYIWSRIEEEGILSKTNYNGIVPIVPIEETADLIQIIDEQPGIATYPYIIYNWAKTNSGQMWAVQTHQAAYSLRSADDEKTRQIINLFDQEFADWDESAKRVNNYLSSAGASQAYLDFDYKYIYASSLGGPEPVEEEGGTNESLITLSITFSYPNKYWV